MAHILLAYAFQKPTRCNLGPFVNTCDSWRCRTDRKDRKDGEMSSSVRVAFWLRDRWCTRGVFSSVFAMSNSFFSHLPHVISLDREEGVRSMTPATFQRKSCVARKRRNAQAVELRIPTKFLPNSDNAVTLLRCEHHQAMSIYYYVVRDTSPAFNYSDEKAV